MSALAPGDPVVAFFDRIACLYGMQMRLERPALRAAALLAEPLAGARVVDLATGTGGFSTALYERHARFAAVVAVDASPRMLERARGRLGRRVPRPRFVQADARRVPLADGSADVVVIGYLLHLLAPDARDEVLAEAFRLLKPEGRLVAVIHSSPTGIAGHLYRAAWRALARGLPGGRLRYEPITDVAPFVRDAGFVVDAAWRLPGVYWSQVLRARRPAAQR